MTTSMHGYEHDVVRPFCLSQACYFWGKGLWEVGIYCACSNEMMWQLVIVDVLGPAYSFLGRSSLRFVLMSKEASLAIIRRTPRSSDMKPNCRRCARLPVFISRSLLAVEVPQA